MHNATTEKYPVACHVFPLNRARKLWVSNALLGREDFDPAMT